MIQCNTSNVKLSNTELNKFKSRMKNGTEEILKLSSNVVGDSNDKNNFLHKSLLTNNKFQSFMNLLQIVLQLI